MVRNLVTNSSLHIYMYTETYLCAHTNPTSSSNLTNIGKCCFFIKLTESTSVALPSTVTPPINTYSIIIMIEIIFLLCIPR